MSNRSAPRQPVLSDVRREKDHDEFLTLRAKAETGDAFSQAKVAYCYATGSGVRRNYRQAMHWFLAAAKGGDESSMYNLGLMYEVGRGVKRDPEEAANWYTQGALSGSLEAELNLGLMYLSGVSLAARGKSPGEKGLRRRLDSVILDISNI
jgi:TPR repeat protein